MKITKLHYVIVTILTLACTLLLHTSLTQPIPIGSTVSLEQSGDKVLVVKNFIPHYFGDNVTIKAYDWQQHRYIDPPFDENGELIYVGEGYDEYKGTTPIAVIRYNHNPVTEFDLEMEKINTDFRQYLVSNGLALMTNMNHCLTKGLYLNGQPVQYGNIGKTIVVANGGLLERRYGPGDCEPRDEPGFVPGNHPWQIRIKPGDSIYETGGAIHTEHLWGTFDARTLCNYYSYNTYAAHWQPPYRLSPEVQKCGVISQLGTSTTAALDRLGLVRHSGFKDGYTHYGCWAPKCRTPIKLEPWLWYKVDAITYPFQLDLEGVQSYDPDYIINLRDPNDASEYPYFGFANWGDPIIFVHRSQLSQTFTWGDFIVYKIVWGNDHPQIYRAIW